VAFFILIMMSFSNVSSFGSFSLSIYIHAAFLLIFTKWKVGKNIYELGHLVS